MQTRYELVLSAVDKGVKAAFNSVHEGVAKGGQAMKAFNGVMGNGQKVASGLAGQIRNLVTAYTGFQFLSGVFNIIKDADRALFTLTASVEAANREFSHIGSVNEWGEAISRFSTRLRVYTESDLQHAVANTIDMTKHLGLSKEQMEELIARSGDLGAGMMDLGQSVDAITKALMGQTREAQKLGLIMRDDYVKALYEASNAHGKAWKDLSELEKVQARFNVLMEQSASKVGRAAESAETFAGAWALVQKAIDDSVSNNKASIDALNTLAETLQENAGNIGSLVSSIVTAISKTVEFALKWKNAIAIFIGTMAAIKIIRTFVLVVQALNAALVVLTGIKVVAWMGALRAALFSVEAAFLAGGVAASAFYAAATLGAVWGIAKVIELGKVIWDTKKAWDSANASAERAAALIDQVKNKYAGFKDVEIPADITSLAQKDLEKLNEDLHKTQAYYRVLKLELQEKAKETLLFGGMTVDAQKAQAELVKVDKRLEEVGAAIKEIGALQIPAIADMEPPVEMVEAIRASREEIEQFMKSAEEAYRHASSEAQKYADKIMKLNFDIADREISLQDRIRDLRRQNMEDYNAAKDLSANAMEKERAAREALLRFQQTGDQRQMDLTRQLAQDADRLWSEYARGGQAATESAISGLERVNKILDQADKEEIGIFERMKDDAEKAMKDIEGWLDILTAARDLDISIELHNLTEAKKQINDLIKDETKKITIEVTKNVTEAKSTGGRVGMAGGGRFPGDSLFDSIPVLARPGEGFVRNEALKVWDRMFGKGFFDGINAPWSTAGQAIIRALQGQIRLPSLPAINRFSSGLAFAGGGRVPGFDIPRMGSVDLQYDGGSYQVIGDVDVLEQLQRAAGRKKRLRPNS